MSDFSNEINTIIDQYIKRKEPILARMVAIEAIQSHISKLPEDQRDFWTNVAYASAREMVRRRINSISENIDGWDHLHDYYVVEREGETQAVHIDNMSKREIEHKINLYRSMGSACFDHARELDRYNINRQKAA